MLSWIMSPPRPSAYSRCLHFDREPRRLRIANRDARHDRAEAFMPHLELVLSRWEVVERELSVGASDHVERMRRDNHPRHHPRVQVTEDAHDFGLGERDRECSILRLREIERSIELRSGMYVVQK